MRVLLLLSGISMVLAIMARTAVPSNPVLESALVHLRAGAKGNANRNSLGTSKFNKGKKSSSKYGKTSRRGQKKGPGLRDKLEKLSKQGQSVFNDVYRRAKVLRSSAFEAMLLKATWPSNEPVQPEILGEIIKYSIPAFKFSSAESEDDPYYMTLHKLWTKMHETDWRTVTKSLYILHTILRDCQTDACTKFGAAIKDMVKTRNPKSPDHKYFDVQKIGEIDALSTAAGLQDYVTTYASYVIFRAKAFTARFDELKSINEKTPEKKVLAALKKAQQCINLGLKAQATEKKQSNAITGYATKQVAADLRDMYALYGEKIALFASGSRYASPAPNSGAAVAEALKFYQDVQPKLKAYLSSNAKQFVRLRIKIPTDLAASKAAPSTESLAARIKELSNVSGGALHSPSTSSTSSTPKSSATGASRESCVSCVAGQCTRHTTKVGVCTRKASVLRRSERPLTPEEVKANLALSASVGGAHGLACSGSADGACGTKEKVKELLKHSAGAKSKVTNDGDDDDNADEEEDDDEEEEEEEGEWVQDERGDNQGDNEDDDEEDDVNNDEEDIDEGDVDEEFDEEEEDEFDDDDEDLLDEDEEEEEAVEAGVERSGLYKQHHAKKSTQRAGEDDDEKEEEEDAEIGDEEYDSDREEEEEED